MPDLETHSYIRSQKLKSLLDGDDPDLDLLSDEEITEQATPTATLWQLRARLWILLDKRNENLEKFGACDDLKVEEIRRGICSEKQFNRFLNNPYHAAFLARPLTSPQSRQQDLLRAAIARQWEILSLPLTDAKGRPDKGLAKIVFDTVKMVVDREWGTAVQRTETLARIQTQNMKPEPVDVKALEQNIKALQERTQHAGNVIEAEEEGGAGT